MRRVALVVLLVPALFALPAGGQAAPEGGGGGDCTTSANPIGNLQATPDLDAPIGLDVDADGHVWVADANNKIVYEFGENGAQLGTIPAGAATPAFQSPQDVAVDPDGRVFVTDLVTDRIYVFSPTGVQQDAIPASAGEPDLVNASSLALNADGTRLWALDHFTATIQRFNTATLAHTLTIPLAGNVDPDPTFARGLGRDANGRLWFADADTNAIYRVDATGEQQLVIPGTTGNPDLSEPNSMTVDSRGNVLVVDQATNAVQRFSPTGTLQFVIDGVANGGLSNGRDVTVGRRGDVWVTSDGTGTVMRWCFRVDAKLRRGSGAFTGDTTVNGTGAGQVLNATVGRNVATNFTLRLDGESNARHRVRVKAPSAAGVRWFNGSQNVTAAVNGAGFVTPFVEPGQFRDLRVEVRTTVARTITIRTSSEAAPERVDIVKLAVRV